MNANQFKEPWQEDEPGNPATWGGKRPGAGRKAGDPTNTGRPPIGASRRIAKSVNLDANLHRLVTWHASARGYSFSESLNQLLAEALRHHDVDYEEREVK